MTCEKYLTPDPDDKNVTGVPHDIDEDASDCEGWEAKDEQKE